ncbi:hypothetical protein GCM10027570_32240 [Streptomonospora sediminis]
MTGDDNRRRDGADEGRDPAPGGLLDDLPETGRGSGAAQPQEPAPRSERPRTNPFHTPADRRRGTAESGTGAPGTGQPNVIPFRYTGLDRATDRAAAVPQARHHQPHEPEGPELPADPAPPQRAEEEPARPAAEPARPAEPERAQEPARPEPRRSSEPKRAPEPQRVPAPPEPGPEREGAAGSADPPQRGPAPRGPREPESPAAAPPPAPAPAPARSKARPSRPRPMAPQYPPPPQAPQTDPAPPSPAPAGRPSGPVPAEGHRSASAPQAPPPAPEAPERPSAASGQPTQSEDDPLVNAHAAASFTEHPDDRAEQATAGRRDSGEGQAAEHAAPAAATRAADPAPARATAPGEHAYGEVEREAVYRAIRERRDVRMGFRTDPIPDSVLRNVLDAAHRAPSVGYSQPWDFIIVTDEDVRARVQKLVQTQREAYARALPGARARAFSGLKVEAVLDTPVNIVVTVDPTRGGRHTLGRHSQPQTASYSTALAVENLWLAARAEGLGVGWVSFFEERELSASLDLPPHLEVVAYLCVGYVEDFPPEPELAMGGWARGRPLHWAVHRDHYGRRGLPGEAATSLLEETISAIGQLNQRALNDAEERQAAMTKPPGSLGVLEEVSVRLSGLAGECPPPIPEPAAVAIFAGDHGVHAQGVTGWPQEVTAQMVHNFLDGGAVVNAFAEQVGAEVTIVDVGVAAELPTVPGLLPRKIARGTADFTRGPAMSRTQVDYAIEAGIEVARDLVSAGNRCLLTGDMGIANTTPSAALVCAFTGADPAEVTGRGTGADDGTLEHKIDVVRRGLAANEIDPDDPVGVLAAVGGLEHAALSGFILGAAAMRVPVLLDGVIAGAAALAAAAMEPLCLNACFAGHRSTEPGHAAALAHIGLRPLVELDMRLGEGSGALLALPILQGSVRALRNVATFDAAGISEQG